MSKKQPALIFDLDGTLVDSVYVHVAVWHQVLEDHRIEVPQCRIHRAVGMSGSSFLPKRLRGFDYPQSDNLIRKLESAHKRSFSRTIPGVRKLAGVAELFRDLSRCEVPFAIATSGGRDHTEKLLHKLAINASIPVLTGDDVDS